MFGHNQAGNSEGRGIIPRAMEELFVQLDRRTQDKDVAVVVSFLEIYCDQIRYHCLLSMSYVVYAL